MRMWNNPASFLPAAGLLLALCSCRPDRFRTDEGGGTDVSLRPSSVSGTVCYADRLPAAGVVVSDGTTCTVTDAEGRYSLEPSPDARFISYSCPSDCAVAIGGAYGLPCFYKPYDEAVGTYDFTLVRTVPEDRFRLIGIADPQVSLQRDVNRFAAETVPDIKAFAAAQDDRPTYGITLGDLVAGKPDLFPEVGRLMDVSSAGIPVFQTIGNHDKVDMDVSAWCGHFGPTDYSFNRGSVHVVVMDNVADDSSLCGFSAAQYGWLQQDLSFVDAGKMVVLCVHVPFRGKDKAGGYYDEVLALLAKHRGIIIAGHTHNCNMDYYLGTPYGTVHEFVLGSACGALWSGTVCPDGGPCGYGVFEFDGASLSNFFYKGTRLPAGCQMFMYQGREDDSFVHAGVSYAWDCVGPGAVNLNVWGADRNWRFEVWENGVKTGIQPVRAASYTAFDLRAKYYFHSIGKTASSYWQATYHMYSFAAGDSSADLKVVAVDPYGNRWECSTFTTLQDTPSTY